MKVLILSSRFPQTHPRAGEPTGFPEAFAEGRKIHTIRANAKMHFRDGDMVSLRTWTGRPYASKQIEFGQVKIGIEPIVMEPCVMGVTCFVGSTMVTGSLMAENDGLSWEDFRDWFWTDSKRAIVAGDILHFTDMRYAL